MKNLLLTVLILSVVGCALRPAPISTLDVRATLTGLAPDLRANKSVEIQTQIDDRRSALRKKRKNFDIAIYSTLWAPLLLAGPIFLCQLPARKATDVELTNMTRQEKELHALIAESGNTE